MINANAQEEAYCYLFITQVNFTRKSLSTMSKNDPHLEELTINIAMDNTELLITHMYIPLPPLMEERDDLCKQDRASSPLLTMNDEITKATSDHKRRQWSEFVESIDHRTDSTKLWSTIKGIDGRE